VDSARRWYLANLAFGLTGTAAVALAGLAALHTVDFGLPSAHALEAACARMLPSRAALVAMLVLALALLAFAVAIRGVSSLLRQLLAHRRALRRLTPQGGLARDDVAAVLIEDPRPTAFCAGYLRPRVFVSTGALALLREAELTAVLQHEAHHARRRDPLRLLVAKALADALFFLPALRRLRTRYAEMAELAADEAAVRATRDPAPLASALLAFEAGVGAGAVGIAPERVDRLLGERPRWNPPIASIASGVATITALVVVSFGLLGALGSQRVELSLVSAQSCTVVMIAALALLCAMLRRAHRRASRRRA